MHYEHNYLTKVVLRLDFDALEQLRQNVQVSVKPEFSNRIAAIYPIVAGQPTATLSVNIGPMGSGINQQITGVQWHHRKVENGTCVVALAPEFLAIEYGKGDFDHFPPFRAEVQTILMALQDMYHVPTFNRIGLRYIDEISIPDGNPLDWNGLIAPDLITSVKACIQEGMDMVRSIHQLHARRNECTMVYNYGLHNPDFPNTLARRSFVLDFDCSRSGVAAGEALQVIDDINNFCESIFENSIQDGLREKMGIIHDQ
jgi:uncharacterized protein (TIGR04255 family)